MGKHVATKRLIAGNQLLRNMVSRDTKTESCKHLDTQTVAWELRHGVRDNAFMKNSNENLGGGDRYSVLWQL
jgi:hypothetical protein